MTKRRSEAASKSRSREAAKGRSEGPQSQGALKAGSDSGAPYGTEQPRPRGVLVLLIVLCAAWLGLLVTLAVHDNLR